METGRRAKLLDDYLSEQETADELRKNRRTIQRWRKERIGPPVTYDGKTPIYHFQSLREWLKSRETRPPRSNQRNK
jgi:hypothetical protein